jgi:S-formylglutathione hydrolase
LTPTCKSRSAGRFSRPPHRPGTADQFLDEQLRPELFSAACAEAGQPFDLRMRAGYDHRYWFIQTFVEEHLRHHAAALL